ncbi:hypothetical protein AMK59_5910 [Oryctes borbonicus]|uniref:Uncharacterized protein n=1 Tax=Oryctes borbonicus TaxID=1629725 RepID=A0A0T6B4T4_9SCAR|nr:hypothetical protein AMK59_5910 [Oryctes borbonicus]
MDRIILHYWMIFVVVVSTAKYGHCNIKCYSCTSQEDPQCLHPEDKLETKKCNKDAMMEMKAYAENIDHRYGERFDVELHTFDPVIPLMCMKQVTVVRGKEYVIRGCQLDSGHPHICTVVTDESKRLNIGNVTHCSLCHSDACNFAARMGSFEITTILITVLAQKIILF